jgi:RNA polymerase sigma-70 factor (ECF subfamily)
MITNKTNCATLPALLGYLARREVTRENLDIASDNELVMLTLRGQSRAYEFLVRRYQKLVYNVVFHMVQNHETAADVTQDTFLRAYNGLHTFRTDARFKPWLLRVANNCALNKLREMKVRDHDSLDWMLEEDAYAEPAASQNVEAEVEWRLSQVMVADALKKLAPRHRQMFLLRYQHDLSYADIAHVTEESEATVKSVLFRTRERLRKLLAEEMKVS